MSMQAKAVLLVPFGYLCRTRMNSRKALLSNLATALLPGCLVAVLWGQGGAGRDALGFLAAYLSFISLYEIGYFWNDTLGTRRDEVPRKRLTVPVSPGFSVLFVAIRLVAWWVLADAIGATGNMLWWVATASLVVVIVLHNSLGSSALKAVTFMQMSVLRFCLPVLPLIPATRVMPLFVLGFLHFTYPRFITYLDAKDRLAIPERKTADYGWNTQLLFLPAYALLAVASVSWVPLVIWSYYLLFQVARSVAQRRIESRIRT